MRMRPFTVLTLLVLSLAVTGCSGFTDVDLITDFQWGEVEDPSTVTEGIDVTVALGELFILGQLNTPTRCYNLTPDFSLNGSTLTLTVSARSTGAANCNTDQGGFRYTAAVLSLDFGTYQLRVVHDIEEDQGGTFTETIEMG